MSYTRGIYIFLLLNFHLLIKKVKVFWVVMPCSVAAGYILENLAVSTFRVKLMVLGKEAQIWAWGMGDRVWQPTESQKG